MLLGAGSALAGACIASGPPIDPINDKDGGFNEGGGQVTIDAPVDAPVTEPHQVVGASPAHGPFAGGQRVVISGNGFASDVRVWFGATEATEVLPVDATKVQVVAPPGVRGPVDLSAQNGDDESTRRTLVGGYTYDALYADPSSGPISGGSDVTIYGQGTSWDASTTAFIDNKACATLSVLSPTELSCTVPQGTPGAKTVRVEGGGETIAVLDGYTYQDSENGYKGGLSGDPLAGSLKVLVYDNFTGNAIPATVIVGDDLSTALVKDVDPSGVAVFDDASLSDKVTVTIVGLCHSPTTFVDVPVDTVTVYLDPVLTPACAGAGGDPPGVGGKSGSPGFVEGEIVFPSINEFEKGPFLVPAPIGNEQQVAYVLATAQNPLQPFQLPSQSAAILPSTDGTIGFGFAFGTNPGNRAYYALAGLEDRTKSPPTFVAYSIGLVRGVPVVAEETTSEVYIDMKPLDLALTLQPEPPPPGPSGPDRLAANVSIRLGADGYVILPAGQKAPLLPLVNDINFVGLPLLDSTFLGGTYYVSARAVTGPTFLTPSSIVSAVQTTTTSFPIGIDGFVGLPTLATPALNSGWDGQHLDVSFGAGAPVDLTVYDVAGGNGLIHWTVAVPGGGRAIRLPDISSFDGANLPSGPITIGIYGARFNTFDYAQLRYRNLRPQFMDAYSLDYVEAHL